MASEKDKAGQEKEYAEAFDDMASLRETRAKLSGLEDGKLALWQAEQKPGSAEFILADHEWRSRRVKLQNRAIYRASVIGALSGIVGVVLGVVLGWYLQN